MLPCFSKAQERYTGRLDVNEIEGPAHTAVKRSSWQVLERGDLRKNVNTFFRFSSINGTCYLDLKVIHGGDFFIVPRNGELKFRLENGNSVTLYSTKYTATTIGDGARAWGGSGAEGATLSYTLTTDDIKQLLHDYVDRIRIYTGEWYVEKRITEYHSEVFMDELALVYYSK